jgi:4-amino-4-deoxy-L-arabinose transferase-like glycosyltransferase
VIASRRLVSWWRGRLAEAWSRPELRWLLAIALLSLVLRTVWVLYAARPPQQLHDQLFYLYYGQRIALGLGYTTKVGEPTAYYPIGYPATLAALFALLIHTPLPDNFIRTAAFFQVVIGSATAVLAYLVARRLFDATVGLLAALWIAVFPNLIYHTGTFLSETLFNFVVFAALTVLFWSGWRRGAVAPWRLLVFGGLLGFSALVRPISLLFLPLLPAVWLWGGAGWRRALTQTALVFAVTAAVIAPWTIRNIVVMKSPILVSANLGDDLCIGHHPNATGHFELPDYCFAGYQGLKGPEFEVRRNDETTRKAIRFAVHNPGAELRLLSRKAYLIWEHDHDGILAVESYGYDPFISATLRTALDRTADIFFFVTISLGGLGLLGFLLGPRDPRRVLALLLLLTLAGVPLIFFGGARFHMPAMPLLSIAAAWAVVAAGRTARRLTTQAVIAPAGQPGP